MKISSPLFVGQSGRVLRLNE